MDESADGPPPAAATGWTWLPPLLQHGATDADTTSNTTPMQLDSKPMHEQQQQQRELKGGGSSVLRLLVCQDAGNLDCLSIAMGRGEEALEVALETVHCSRAALGALAALPDGRVLAVQQHGDVLMLAEPQTEPLVLNADAMPRENKAVPPASGWDYPYTIVPLSGCVTGITAASAQHAELARGAPASAMQRDASPGPWTPATSLQRRLNLDTPPATALQAAGRRPLARHSEPAARSGYDHNGSSSSIGAMRRRLALLQRLHQPGPLGSMVFADLLGDGCPQIFGASARPQGGLQLLRGTAPAAVLAASAPGMVTGVSGVWSVTDVGGAPLVVVTAPGGSRAMAAICSGGGGGNGLRASLPAAAAAAAAAAAPPGQSPRSPQPSKVESDPTPTPTRGSVSLIDVTDAIGLCATEATLCAGGIGEGAVAQVTPGGAYLCCVEAAGAAAHRGDGPGAAWRCSTKSSRGSREMACCGGRGGSIHQRDESPLRPGRSVMHSGSGGGSGSGDGRPSVRGRSPLVRALQQAAQAAAAAGQVPLQQQQQPTSSADSGAVGGGESVEAEEPEDMSASLLPADSGCDMMAVDDDATSSGAQALVAHHHQQQQQQLAAECTTVPAAAPDAAAPDFQAPRCWAGSHWAAPAGETVVLAAVAPGLIASYLAPSRRLALVTAEGGAAEQSGGGLRCASPSRKRGRGGWRLVEIGGGCGVSALDTSSAQLSCLHAAAAPPGLVLGGEQPPAAGGAISSSGQQWWLLGGRYDGCVEVALVGQRGGNASRVALLSPSDLRGRPKQTATAVAGTSAATTTTRSAALDVGAAVPHSIVVLPDGWLQRAGIEEAGSGTNAGSALAFLVSFRDGWVALYELLLTKPAAAAAAAAVQPPQQQQQQQQQQPAVQMLGRIRASTAPIQLVPGPLQPGAPHESELAAPPLRLLAVGEHVWVLTMHAATQSLSLQQLALSSALYAAPLALPASAAGSASPAHCLPTLVCARRDGSLALACPELCSPPHIHHSLQGLALRHLLTLEGSRKLIGLGGPSMTAYDPYPPHPIWPPPTEGVHVIDPAAGALLCTWALKQHERGTAACSWPAPSLQLARGSRTSSAASAEDGPAAGGGSGSSSAPPTQGALFHIPDLLKRFREQLRESLREPPRQPPSAERSPWSIAPSSKHPGRGAAARGGGGAGPSSSSWDGASGSHPLGASSAHQMHRAAAHTSSLLVVGTANSEGGARQRRRQEQQGRRGAGGMHSDDSSLSSPETGDASDEVEGGRVCVLQLVRWSVPAAHGAATSVPDPDSSSSATGTWALRLVTSLRMPFGVTAVTPVDDTRLMIGMGGFIACYGLGEGRRLRQLGAVAARAPVTSLAVLRDDSTVSPTGGGGGGNGGTWLVAAADKAQGLVVYRLEQQAKESAAEVGQPAAEGQDGGSVVLQALWAHDEVRPLLHVRPFPLPAFAAPGGAAGSGAALLVPSRGGRWLCLDAAGNLLDVGGAIAAAAAEPSRRGTGGGSASSDKAGGSGKDAGASKPGSGASRLPLAGRMLNTLAELQLGAGPAVAVASASSRGGRRWHVVCCSRDGGLVRCAPLPAAAGGLLAAVSDAASGGGDAWAGGRVAGGRRGGQRRHVVLDVSQLRSRRRMLLTAAGGGGGGGSVEEGQGAVASLLMLASDLGVC